MDDQQLRFGVVENILNLSRGKTIVERDQGCADEGGSEVGFQEDMTIVMQNGYLAARTEALLSQEMSQPEHPPGKLFIGEGPLMTANRFFLRVSAGGF